MGAGSASIADKTLHAFQKAKLFVYETAYSAYREVRTITDFRLIMETEEAPEIVEWRSGQEVVTERYNIRKRYRMGFKPQVAADPTINLLLLGDPRGAPVHSAGGGYETLKYIYNFGNSPIFLPPGTASSLANSVLTAAGAAQATVGGTLADDNYIYQMVAVFGDTNSNTPAVVGGDRTTEVTVAAADNAILVTWTNQNTIGVPNSYKVYRKVHDAVQWYYLGETNDLSWLDEGAAGTAATLPTGAALTVTDLAGTTTFAAGSDYDYSSTYKRLILHSGTTIDLFQQVIVTCSVEQPETVEQQLAPSSWEATYNKVRIEQLREVDSLPTGLVLTLYRVKTNGAGATLQLMERDFSSFDAIEWEAFFDDTTNLFGLLTHYNDVLASIA